MTHTITELARYFDHSLLHPTLTDQEIKEGCLFAKGAGVASVCVKPASVSAAASLLKGSGVAVGTVVGFPQGSNDLQTKIFETELAIEQGATEIDAVLNIGKIASGEWLFVKDEMAALTKACRKNGARIKIIFENDFLSDDQIIRLCDTANEVGPDFVKTSTGFGFVKTADGHYTYKGATPHHLTLMRERTRKEIGLKAAGGIRTMEDVLRILPLGVARIGATATPQILIQAERRGFSQR